MTTRIWVMVISATIGLTGVLLAGQQEEKQADVEIQADDVDVQAEVQRRDRENLQETTQRQTKMVHRASALIGLDVKNAAGEDLGDIHDLTINDHGKVEYAAISFGGFVNIGDKFFAVPWEAIEIKREDPDGDDWIALVNISERDLETARGFDKDNWPNMADEKWRTENARAFRTTQRERETTTEPVPRR